MNDASKPLVVDLDGTLTPVDTLHEAAVGFVLSSPLRIPEALFALVRHGKAEFKAIVSDSVSFDPETLPMTADVLKTVEAAISAGRTVVLCTASDKKVGESLAAKLHLFDHVICSDGQTNMSGEAKAEALIAAYGFSGFDYIGNALVDLPVWRAADQAIVVSNDSRLVAKAQAQSRVAEVIAPQTATVKTWGKQLRLHQWSKNFLLFVPLLASQSYGDPSLVLQLLLGFVVFGCIASATYIFNDLVDLQVDRRHAAKKHRPLAIGLVSVKQAIAVSLLMLLVGFGLAAAIGPAFLVVATAYLLATASYSMFIKRIVMLDCLWLAGLFTLRIVAGAAAIGQAMSHWLLIFSVFLFLSLAYLKRFVELRDQKDLSPKKLAGRGYIPADEPLVFALGLGAGYASTVVLSLYLFSPAAIALYPNPYALVLAIPILVYWLSHMWLTAHRGQLHHDPVMFALTDRTSLVSVILFFAVFGFGAFGAMA